MGLALISLDIAEFTEIVVKIFIIQRKTTNGWEPFWLVLSLLGLSHESIVYKLLRCNNVHKNTIF